MKRVTDKETQITKTTGIFKSLDGNIVVQEDGELKGSNLISVKTVQKQLKESGEIKIEGKKIKFTFRKEGKAEESDSEDISERIVVPANLEPFTLENWDALLKNEAIDFKFALWDRLETVSFSMKKSSDLELNGEKLIKFRLKPRNFIISSLVDSIFLTWNKEKKVLVIAESRVAPYLKVEDGFKPLDAIVKYFYPVNP